MNYFTKRYYGKNSGVLVPFLESPAKALGKLGHEDEANAVEKRLHALQQAVARTN